ncbi:MAG: hypothetical protein ACPGVJ_10075, partial [Mangrovicoccus sp.]
MRAWRNKAWAGMLCLAASGAMGQDTGNSGAGLPLTLPGAAWSLAQRIDPSAIYSLPQSAAIGQAPDLMDFPGRRMIFAAQSADPHVTEAGLWQWLSEELSRQGYEMAFQCATQSCGGFDFRRALETLAPPEMYVDLRSFYYGLALPPTNSAAPQPAKAVSVLISRFGDQVTLQITQIIADELAPAPNPGLPDFAA